MRAGLTVLQIRGLIYSCREAPVLITAAGETLSAWTSEDGSRWDEVAVRDQPTRRSLVELYAVAKEWCRELRETGQV